MMVMMVRSVVGEESGKKSGRSGRKKIIVKR